MSVYSQSFMTNDDDDDSRNHFSRNVQCPATEQNNYDPRNSAPYITYLLRERWHFGRLRLIQLNAV